MWGREGLEEGLSGLAAGGTLTSQGEGTQPLPPGTHFPPPPALARPTAPKPLTALPGAFAVKSGYACG